MDAGMRAIASFQRDSLSSTRSKSSCPAPAGAPFVLPRHPYAAGLPPMSPLRKQYGAGPYGPSATAAGDRESIGMAMTRNSEDEQQSETPFPSTAAPNPAAVPLPLSPPPLTELSLDDHPLPSPLPQASYMLPPQRPGSDFVVVLPRRAPEFSPEYEEDFAPPAPVYRDNPPLRFKEVVSIIPEQGKWEWDGGYAVQTPLPSEDTNEKPRLKSRSKRALWILVVLIVAAAVGVGIGFGVSKSSGSPSSAGEAAVSAGTSALASSALAASSLLSIPSSTSRSSARLATSPSLASSSSSVTSSLSASPTPRSRPLASTTTTESEPSIASPTTTRRPTTTSAVPTRTAPSATEVLCTISIVGLPRGATTVVLPAGMSCPTGRFNPRTREIEEEEEEDVATAQRAVLRRHLRSRRG